MSVSTSAHTLKKFDDEMGTLRDLVIKMGGSVEEQLRTAMLALEREDTALAEQVIEADRQIDRFEIRADEEIAQLLARRAPLGIDLRTILTLSKTVNDLERIGDEAKKIARVTRGIIREGLDKRNFPLLGDTSALSRAAVSMLRGALDALVRLDLEQATRVLNDDDALDDSYKQLLQRITDLMSQSPGVITLSVQIIFVIKALERIGDHSKNIAEYVFYLVEGRDVRHPAVNPR